MNLRQQSKKEIDPEKMRYERQLASDMRKVFGSAEGQNVLRWIMGQCGYQSPNVVVHPQTFELYENSTDYNESRRILYLQMRKYLTPKILIPVEIAPPETTKKTIKKEGSDVKKSTKSRSRS